jgi:hypothetical protein
VNLTSVQRVKDYLGLTNPLNSSDAVIAQLIVRESAQVVNWCSNPFQRQSFTNQRLNGTGSSWMRVPNTPIISVGALTLCDNVAVPVSANGVQTGYQFDDLNVFLYGGSLFPMGRRNIGLTYVSGYTTTETDFVPAANTITPTAGGYATVDRGVANATSNVPYTLVGGNAPLTGNYSFSVGIYTFNNADVGANVTLSYDYAPGPVEQAVIELVGTVLKQRDNLGIKSKSLRDETIVYSDVAMSNSVQGLLWPYRKVVPV